MLRHHHSPVTDLLVGSRTDPIMVSAAADGTVATWDFRTLSDSSSNENATSKKDGAANCKVVRLPAATMEHCLDGKRKMAAGPVMLARGVTNPRQSILSIGSDAVVREWDAFTGNLVDESPTGHCDAISSFCSFGIGDDLTSEIGPLDRLHKGVLTSSWDGTIRMRRLVQDRN